MEYRFAQKLPGAQYASVKRGGWEINGDDLVKILEALANPHRLRIIALLKDRRIHVSRLAREAKISRPLLYMHLKKLETAGLVTSKLELAEDGKAMNYYELAPFTILLNPESIAEAVKTLTIQKAGSTTAGKSTGDKRGDN
ncbi:ArsR/SmtB family transcription factor [Desulfallas thermosapovorans]|uniref:ArsR/SmtB family transcription factor n=1 Tax=Desulfallas thermosapovorans TaxID=58137 RepID=UPI001FA9D2B1|nr:winged helix-turn-helix domain-containing protein [Desulfallas thermosapovorans]